jgi:hypothetical protein
MLRKLADSRRGRRRRARQGCRSGEDDEEETISGTSSSQRSGRSTADGHRRRDLRRPKTRCPPHGPPMIDIKVLQGPVLNDICSAQACPGPEFFSIIERRSRRAPQLPGHVPQALRAQGLRPTSGRSGVHRRGDHTRWPGGVLILRPAASTIPEPQRAAGLYAEAWCGMPASRAW